MDILDIIIARAKSFTGETKTLINRAKKAMSDAETVTSQVSAIEDDAIAAKTMAEEASAEASAAAAEFDEMKSDITSAAALLVDDAIDAKIDELNLHQGTKVTITDKSTSAAKVQEIKLEDTDATSTHQIKNYTTIGNNEDGSMTQKAITAEINKMISGNLGNENQGKIVVVGQDGSIAAGDVTEDEIKEAISGGGSVTPTPSSDSLGIIIDYENKTVTRTGVAEALMPGADFDEYSMYGGRKRCNVNANGQITAWYGDANYKEDGSNGDVMVYQPKFYYKRTINKVANGIVGKIVRKETLLISETPATGFKLHPRFKDASGQELQYILFSAYEGSVYDSSLNKFNINDSVGVDFNSDYLTSCADAKPISGQNNTLTAANAEKLAVNKGTGWHITDIGVESINQMLFMVEYASLNSQASLGLGVSNLSTASNNNSVRTGFTSTLGDISGEGTNSTVSGEKVVSYRGFENPWGNIWRFVGGFNVVGDNSAKVGIPYIATNFNYDPENLEGYESLEFAVAGQSSWITGMGYGNEKYDWIYFPAECINGNSAVPVGDNFWTITTYNQTSVVGVGGTWSFGLYNGLFYYSCDRNYDYKSYSYSARLMHIPTKNSIHDANYNNWLTKIGG